MIKKLHPSTYWILFILCAALLLSSCSSEKKVTKDSTSVDRGLAVVNIPDIYDPTGVYQPYIAEELGYFKEEGIQAIFTGVIPPGQHVAAVVAGTNDVGTLHINRTIAGIQAGAKVKAVVAGSETTKDYPHMTFIVLENSPIKTAQDLIGKKLGLNNMGGCQEYTPYEWLKKNGVSNPKGKVPIIQVPVGNEEQVLRSGQVDVVGYHGYPKDVFNRGGVRVLFDDFDVWGTVGGATPFYFSNKFIAENPNTVRGFVRAIARAQDWANAHPDQAIALQAQRLKLDPQKITIMHYAEHGIIKEDSVKLWLDILTNYDELKQQFKFSDIATNEFNDYENK